MKIIWKVDITNFYLAFHDNHDDNWISKILPANNCANFPIDPWRKWKIGRISWAGGGRKAATNGWTTHRTELIIPISECEDVFHLPMSIQMIATAEITNNQTIDIQIWWITNQRSFPNICNPFKSDFPNFADNIPIAEKKIHAEIMKIPWRSNRTFDGPAPSKISPSPSLNNTAYSVGSYTRSW